jgi:hypothetical protein
MSASSLHFLRATTGAPTADDEPVKTSHRFGTTTVPDSLSHLEEVFSASDMLRRGVKEDSTYRAGRQGNERDDEVPYREAGWRAGRRPGERDDGVGIAIEAARRRGGEEGGAPRMGRGNPILAAGNGWKLPKSYRNLIEIDFGINTPPPLSKSLPNFDRFR